MLLPFQQQIQLLFQNSVFLAAIFSWLSAQFIKTIIKLFSGQVRSLRELLELLFWRTGGMPSSHSALVSSVSTSIGFRSGVTSDVFVLSLCFALVVIRDAVGVRRSSGLQAHTLNEIGKRLEEEALLTFKPVKEIQGHKPFEVITGCFLGFFVGVAFSTL
ncbi:MAG: divergent PAP2 family protein [Spirochaetaceae bacterium]|jgi:acid phosphatase family membrane protein YuiD|nr:divergent PAP2 family protein [Spirochaetaceae bacterium]